MWGAKAEGKMREFLGEAQSAGIDKNREKTEKTYPLADKTSSLNNFLDYSYLGQLAMLMEGIDWRMPQKTWRPAMVG